MNDKPLEKWTKTEIIAFLDERFGTLENAKEKLETFNTDVESVKNAVTDSKDAIDTKLNELDPLISNIQDYYRDLLKGDKVDDKGNPIPSIKKELEDYIKHIKTEIRDLLPGAGAAGLSKTYFEAKKRYGVLSVNEMVGGISNNKMHLTTTGFKTLLFYSMFIVPLVAIVLMFYDIVLNSDDYEKLGNLVYSFLLIRVFIAAPLAGISWFGLYSIRVNRQLYEEYNHKQRVMELYHSFSDVLEEYNAEEYAKNLLGIMMETVNAKPSLDLRKDKIKKEKGGEPAPKPQDITNN